MALACTRQLRSQGPMSVHAHCTEGLIGSEGREGANGGVDLGARTETKAVAEMRTGNGGDSGGKRKKQRQESVGSVENSKEAGR